MGWYDGLWADAPTGDALLRKGDLVAPFAETTVPTRAFFLITDPAARARPPGGAGAGGVAAGRGGGRLSGAAQVHAMAAAALD